MFKIDVKWEFDERRFRSEITKAAFKAAVEQRQRALATVRCPEHGTYPSLRVVGQTEDQLNLELETCCQGLMDAAHQRLGHGG